MAITSGTYALLSVLDPSVRLDVTNGSNAKGANLELWVENDGTQNNQLFYIPPESGGYIYLQSPGSGNVIDAEYSGGTPQSGNNLIMWSYHGGDNQLFKAISDGTATYNGTSVNAYRFQSKSNNTLYFDACGGGTQPGTNVWLWEYLAWQDGQRWIPVKTSAYAADLPVPADIGVILSGGELVRKVGGVRGAETLTPVFTSAFATHQMRYRTRTRSSTDPDVYRGAWSDWASIADGSTTDDGWGDAWTANCTTTEVNGRHTCSTSISIDVNGTTCDLIEIQIEVRAFTTNWGLASTLAHGPSASTTITIARAPQVTVSGLTFAPDGLRIAYTSDFARDNNRLETSVVVDGDLCAPRLVSTYMGYSSTVLHPTESLVFVPEDTAPADIDLALTTTDGVTVAGTITDAVAYNGGSAVISPTVTFYSGPRICGVDPNIVGYEVHVWAEGPQGFQEIQAPYMVPYPIGVDWTLWIVAYDSPSSWGVWSDDYTATVPDGFRFNWSDNWCRIRCGEGESPKAAIKTSADGQTSLTVGRAFEVAHIGKSRSRSISVDGVILHGETGALESFEALSAARFATFRDGMGTVERVAIMETTQDPTAYGWSSVSVDCRVVSN